MEKIIYYFRRILNDTKFKILVGFLTLVFLMLPFLFFLDNNYWIIFFNNLIILSFILFNKEIKNFFYKIGLRYEHVYLKYIDPLVDTGYEKEKKMTSELLRIREASFQLAKEKEGALICFELNHLLDEFTENSVFLNSDISSELLVTIFNKKSPLHDGAVVISKNKIKTASSYFPITENKNKTLGRTYGARHRAAIGITEKTDALVVLVSEEKGTVHIIKDGVLSKSLDREEFNSVILSYL